MVFPLYLGSRLGRDADTAFPFATYSPLPKPKAIQPDHRERSSQIISALFVYANACQRNLSLQPGL
jgi:hypothetical protein